MTVLKKEHHDLLKKQLDERIEKLVGLFEKRELNRGSEGCSGHSSWAHPELMCATIGRDTEIRLAVDDFKTILAEIRKLK